MSNISRNTFDKLKHYVGVRLQQGVPLVDADWNEQEDIFKHQFRALVKSVVGDGVPKDNDGFKIEPLDTPGNNFKIKGGTPDDPGLIFVDGMEVFCESDTGYLSQVLYTDSTKAAAWSVTGLTALTVPAAGAADRTDFVYLDVWERIVDSGEDVDLRNPDIDIETCYRMKREWVVRVAEGASGLPAPSAGHSFYKLAEITRRAGQDAILEADIADKRRTGLGIPDYDFLDTVMVRNGNVGIDTDTPEVKLDVRGDTSIGDRSANSPEIFQADNTDYGDSFGQDIDIDGDQAIVGAHRKGLTVSGQYYDEAGAAYILNKNSDGEWEQVTELHAPVVQAESHFGVSVSISGDRAIVGAWCEDLSATITRSGAAYVFEKQSGVWTQTAKLLAETQETNDYFGRSVQIDGSRVLVGAYGKDAVISGTTVSGGGVAYIFDRNTTGTWSRTQALVGTEVKANDQFGAYLALKGDQAIVGAMGTAELTGAAYIFKKDDGNVNTWSQTARLTEGTGAEAGDRFGRSMAIDGDMAVVGAYFDNSYAKRVGAVYVFEKDDNGDWSQSAKLKPLKASIFTTFGSCVSINGNQLICGAPRAHAKEPKSSAVYIFQKDNGTWSQKQVLKSDSGPADDLYGHPLASSSNYLMVAATADGTGGTNAGAIYIYKKDSDGLWQSMRKYDGGDLEIQGTLHFNKNRRTLIDVPGTGHEIGIHPNHQYYRTEDNFAFYRGDSMQMALKDGNLGIGTDEPAVKLDVRGNMSIGTDDDYYQHVLFDDNGKLNERFGYSVAVEGDRAVVGAPYKASDDATPKTNAGAAYIFEKDSQGKWIRKKTIISDSPDVDDYVGFRVSISGDYCMISAHGDDTTAANAGSVFVYKRGADGNWAFSQKLQSSDVQAEDFFGGSVSMDGDYAIIGAHGEDSDSTSGGAAYIFKKDDSGVWAQTQKLLPSQIRAHDHFGLDVFIKGDRAIVGADGTDKDSNTSVYDAGAAYIYEKGDDDQWTMVKRVQEYTGGTHYHRQGVSVCIDDDLAVTGANGDDTTATNSGAAYVYERDASGTWTRTATLKADVPEEEDEFGFAVGINGDEILISAVNKYCEIGGKLAGAIYIFKKDSQGNWVQTNKVENNDSFGEARFGSSLDTDGNKLIVGSYANDISGINVGAAFIYERNADGDWEIYKTNSNADESGTLNFPDYPGAKITVPGTHYQMGQHKNTMYFNSDRDYAFYQKGASVVVINDGKMGIGTEDPGGDYLDVRGRAYASGGWGSTNADYAEYFESSNGKEIPPGTAVSVTQTGKIRPAKEGETPIGIISISPSVVGNSPKEWPGKYLRDDFGRILEETVQEEIANEDGSIEKVTRTRPKLNPNYDPEKEYIPRTSDDRPEWCCVGLLGQLPMLKGQPTAPTWIKIKTISKKVELWLVK